MQTGKAVRLFCSVLCASLFLTLAAPTVSAQRASKAAADGIPPSISAIDPASAFNDLDTPVTISGVDFASDGSGTPPTVSLGSSALTNVSWVDSATLTASVPWGMDPGVYTLTVVNPDGGTGSLANAFTVAQGIGQWNGGNLFGGEVRQILMKPGDPNTLYAPAYGVNGLFRSRDAGEHWSYISATVGISNGKFAVGPQHPSWIYGFDYKGLQRSQDEGDTWTTLMPNIWPDKRSMKFSQVYVSPDEPQVLFVSSSEAYGDPNASGALGLIKSKDGGVSWDIVLNDIPAQDLAFDPNQPGNMVLVTSDGRVFQSINGGDTWSVVTKPPISSLGFGGLITYNPYRPGEVWIATGAVPSGIYKSSDAAFTSWQDVNTTDGMGSGHVTFTSADSVYIARRHSVDGGQTWQPFGPMTSMGDLRFDPNNPQIGYIGDDTYGVQKTSDGGQTWHVKNQGLTGMICNSLEISPADPLRLFATFGDSMGIYRSIDGAANWTYLPIAGSIHIGLVREDPFDAQHLYVASHTNIYVSPDGGESWSDLGWNASPPAPAGMLWGLAADPYQAGHLLAATVYGQYGLGTGVLYSSTDYGVSWQAVSLPQQTAWISDIAFDPETPGLVYFTTFGTGFYRSIDHGASWLRKDDPQQPDMKRVGSISIATHPRHVLLVQGESYYPYLSLDGGATWKKALSIPSGGNDFMFADRDSTRLYYGTGIGLFFSGNGGDSWTPAAGVLGRSQILALGYGATPGGQTIIYAATSGGGTAASGSGADEPLPGSPAAAGNLVDAGVYRYVQRSQKSKMFYSAGAQDGWVLESGEKTDKGGTLNNTGISLNLGDNAAKKQYRGILSFNTGAGLPDNAVITKVVLKIKKLSTAGAGNPLTIFQGLLVDVQTGFFSTKANLQTADFQAATGHAAVGPFKPVPVNNWYSINLTSAKAYINMLSASSGLTQLRLRFKLDDNNNAIANTLSLYSGNAAAGSRPQLIITYYVR